MSLKFHVEGTDHVPILQMAMIWHVWRPSDDLSSGLTQKYSCLTICYPADRSIAVLEFIFIQSALHHYNKNNIGNPRGKHPLQSCHRFESVFTHFLFILIHVHPRINSDSFRFFPFYPFVAHPALYDHRESIPAYQVWPLSAPDRPPLYHLPMAQSHYTDVHKNVTRCD